MILLMSLVGLVLSLLFLLGPLALEVATTLGLTASVVGAPLAPAVGFSVVVGVLLYVVATALLYFGGSAATGTRPASGPVTPAVSLLEQTCRGLLLGIQASGHLVFTPLAYVALVPIFPPLALLVPFTGAIAIYLCVLNLLAGAAAGNRTYDAFLGWSSVLSPMSWPVTLVGALFAIYALAAAALGFPLRVTMEWWTLTAVFHGTVPAFFPTAYNLGSFAFVTREFRPRSPSPELLSTGFLFLTADGVVFHETGHTLSAAAFGPAFHYVGAVDENFLGSGLNAYAELLAESQGRDATRPFLAMWAPPIVPALGATGSNSPPTTTAAWPVSIPPPVAAVGQVLALDASTGVADPDGFPLGAISPGVSPRLGFLWFIAPPAGSLAALADDSADPNTYIPDRGGDYTWLAVHTDGMNGGFVPSSLMSVVEARANGPYSGTPGVPVALSAAGSTAGSAGALPSEAAGGVPALTLQWAVTSGPAGATIDDPTSEAASFQAPAGNYVLTLTVAAGGVSHAASTTVTVA